MENFKDYRLARVKPDGFIIAVTPVDNGGYEAWSPDGEFTEYFRPDELEFE